MEHKELGCVLYMFKKEMLVSNFIRHLVVFFFFYTKTATLNFLFFFFFISCFHDFLTIFIFFYRFSIRAVSTLFDRFNSTEDSRWCVGYIHETVIDHVTCIFVSLYFFVFLCCYIYWSKVLIYFYLSCLLIVYIG
jgi:hypothetical protein